MYSVKLYICMYHTFWNEYSKSKTGRIRTLHTDCKKLRLWARFWIGFQKISYHDLKKHNIHAVFQKAKSSFNWQTQTISFESLPDLPSLNVYFAVLWRGKFRNILSLNSAVILNSTRPQKWPMSYWEGHSLAFLPEIGCEFTKKSFLDSFSYSSCSYNLRSMSLWGCKIWIADKWIYGRKNIFAVSGRRGTDIQDSGNWRDAAIPERKADLKLFSILALLNIIKFCKKSPCRKKHTQYLAASWRLFWFTFSTEKDLELKLASFGIPKWWGTKWG